MTDWSKLKELASTNSNFMVDANTVLALLADLDRAQADCVPYRVAVRIAGDNAATASTTTCGDQDMLVEHLRGELIRIRDLCRKALEGDGSLWLERMRKLEAVAEAARVARHSFQWVRSKPWQDLDDALKALDGAP
jgi:hypothetical protein